MKFEGHQKACKQMKIVGDKPQFSVNTVSKGKLQSKKKEKRVPKETKECRNFGQRHKNVTTRALSSMPGCQKCRKLSH